MNDRLCLAFVLDSCSGEPDGAGGGEDGGARRHRCSLWQLAPLSVKKLHIQLNVFSIFSDPNKVTFLSLCRASACGAGWWKLEERHTQRVLVRPKLWFSLDVIHEDVFKRRSLEKKASSFGLSGWGLPQTRRFLFKFLLTLSTTFGWSPQHRGW